MSCWWCGSVLVSNTRGCMFEPLCCNDNYFTACQQSCRKLMFSVRPVCNAVHRGGIHVTITHLFIESHHTGSPKTCSNLLNLDFTVQGLHSLVAAKTGGLFKLVPLRTPPLPHSWHLADTETHTVGKRVLHILLEKFLDFFLVTEFCEFNESI